METKDCNGTLLQDGDTVKTIKDLKVKGTNMTIKRGTVVKGIRITQNADEIDCRVQKSKIVLRTEYVQKQ